jgi:ABC-type sulfate/molybdate transport systems ATPase subunit
MTVAQNIRFGLAGWARPAARQRLEELLAQTGLEACQTAFRTSFRAARRAGQHWRAPWHPDPPAS